jgi:hypothetical protein
MEIKFRISETQRGLIIMAGGLLLLLQSMNILAAGLNAIIIIAALGMIAYGFLHAGLDTKIKSLIKK